MTTQRERDIAKAIEIAHRVDAGLESLSPYDTVDYLNQGDDVAGYLDAVMNGTASVSPTKGSRRLLSTGAAPSGTAT